MKSPRLSQDRLSEKLAAIPLIPILEEMNFKLRLATGWHCLMLSLVGAIAHGSEEAVQVDTGVSLLKTWSPAQHLYIRRDVGLTASALAQLEQWLDLRGQNWTVFLAKNAQNESFRNAFNRTLTEVEAVKKTVTSVDEVVAKTIQVRESRRTSQIAQTKTDLLTLENRVATISEKPAAIASELEGDGGATSRGSP